MPAHADKNQKDQNRSAGTKAGSKRNNRFTAGYVEISSEAVQMHLSRGFSDEGDEKPKFKACQSQHNLSRYNVKKITQAYRISWKQE